MLPSGLTPGHRRRRTSVVGGTLGGAVVHEELGRLGRGGAGVLERVDVAVVGVGGATAATTGLLALGQPPGLAAQGALGLGASVLLGHACLCWYSTAVLMDVVEDTT